MKGSALLQQFLESRGILNVEAARCIGVVPSAITLWLGGAAPRAFYRHKLERWTGGQVPALSWFSDKEQRQLAATTAWPSGRRRTRAVTESG